MTSNQTSSIGFGFSTPENTRKRIFSKCTRILAPQIKYEFYALSTMRLADCAFVLSVAACFGGALEGRGRLSAPEYYTTVNRYRPISNNNNISPSVSKMGITYFL